MNPAEALKPVTSASSLVYPFDVYRVNTSLAIVDSTTNRTIPLVACAADLSLIYCATLKKHRCAITATLQGWRTSSYNVEAGYHGVNFDGTGCVLELNLARDYVLRALAIIILILMWSTTITVGYMTLRTVVLGEKLAPSLYTFPATILFALPALRSTLPDAPPYGA